MITLRYAVLVTDAKAALPWNSKFLLVVLNNTYSPNPLNVYLHPSTVVTWVLSTSSMSYNIPGYIWKLLWQMILTLNSTLRNISITALWWSPLMKISTIAHSIKAACFLNTVILIYTGQIIASHYFQSLIGLPLSAICCYKFHILKD